jgi:hypothetical protein
LRSAGQRFPGSVTHVGLTHVRHTEAGGFAEPFLPTLAKGIPALHAGTSAPALTLEQGLRPQLPAFARPRFCVEGFCWNHEVLQLLGFIPPRCIPAAQLDECLDEGRVFLSAKKRVDLVRNLFHQAFHFLIAEAGKLLPRDLAIRGHDLYAGKIPVLDDGLVPLCRSSRKVLRTHRAVMAFASAEAMILSESFMTKA